MKFGFFLLALTANVFLAAQKSEEVVLNSNDSKIYGTLLLPEGKKEFKVALIISGSGPTDRDGNNSSFENNSLKMLAEDLANHGIASLRFDKRGVAQSAETSIDEADVKISDFVHDVENWIDFLINDKRFKEIVIVGHSEGSLIGMLAAQKKEVSKYISIAGAARPANEIILAQIQENSPFFAVPSKNILDSLTNGHRVNAIPQALEVLFRPSVQPYLISWFKYNPQVEIAKLNIPVLIIQGTTDMQVPVTEAEALAEANENAKLVIIDQMNHILKESSEDKTENFKTYSNPTLPLAEGFTKVIIDFIEK